MISSFYVYLTKISNIKLMVYFLNTAQEVAAYEYLFITINQERTSLYISQ